MKVTIMSIFRNAEHYIDRYFSQIDALKKELDKSKIDLNLILGYGDSRDSTDALLFEESISRGMDISLQDVNHGGKEYGSIENPERFKQLAIIGNTLLKRISPDTNILGIVESDLIWKPEVVQTLLEDLLFVGCVAPMVMDSPPKDTFYDVYAFRRYGERLTKEKPYFTPPDVYENPGFYRMDSVGSFVFIDAHIARQVNFTEDEAIVGLCRRIKELGHQIYLNTEVSVYHP